MLLELMETSQDGEESGEYGLSPVIEINFKRDFPKSCPGKGQPQVAENCTHRVRKCYFTAQCTLSGDKGNRGDGEPNIEPNKEPNIEPNQEPNPEPNIEPNIEGIDEDGPHHQLKLKIFGGSNKEEILFF